MVPVRLTSMTRAKVSMSNSAPPRAIVPAQLTRASSRRRAPAQPRPTQVGDVEAYDGQMSRGGTASTSSAVDAGTVTS